MSRISETFAHLKSAGKRGLIPFITAGDPDLETTRNLLLALARAGSDVIELGVPFSDPIADGPVIQRASERALRRQISVAEILEVVKGARREMDVPVVIFSYLNPLLQFGVTRFAAEAARAGVDAVLLTDLPLEEAGEFTKELSANALDLILLVAPTSTDERLRIIAEKASGFIYAVSRTGVTGATTELSNEAEKLVKRVRAVSQLPVAVGFGISNAEQVADVWRYADAAVVGSAIVAEIERNGRVERTAGRGDLIQVVEEFVRALKPTQSNTKSEPGAVATA
ncbi:MAG TPA: tryptophan synthase subunit alpha [Blastocatellia bacterium]|nr:tryptophan synthase subunit alpha [Blastocatellia bacterium]HAF24840.1 tryptophan synthase subunit alpha [Blastocatellia bacterium]